MDVNRCSLVLGIAALLVATPGHAAPHRAQPEPVYKVDKVTAAANDGRLVVTAHGATSSGGWTSPHLRQKFSKDAHVMAFEFVAVPPPPDAAVIQALVPIQAETTATVPAARVSEIRVDSETDDTTVALPAEEDDGEASEGLSVVHSEQ